MNHSEGRRQRMLLVLAGLLVALALVAAQVRITYARAPAAPRAASYDISWYTVAGGGGEGLSGGGYWLGGTVGQFDAGVETGGGFIDHGGFWLQANLFGYQLYLPLVLR